MLFRSETATTGAAVVITATGAIEEAAEKAVATTVTAEVAESVLLVPQAAQNAAKRKFISERSSATATPTRKTKETKNNLRRRQNYAYFAKRSDIWLSDSLRWFSAEHIFKKTEENADF